MRHALTYAAIGAVALLIGGLAYTYTVNTALDPNRVSGADRAAVSAFLAEYASTSLGITGINVGSVESMADGSFLVEGEAQTGTGTYPVTLRVHKADDTWAVTGFTRSLPVGVGRSPQTTVEGVWTCLPGSEGGSSTCTPGVLLDGAYYAVAAANTPTFAPGTPVRVSGVMVPIYPTATSTLRYRIDGVIDALEISAL